MNLAVSVHDLCKSYPGVVALDHMNFQVEKGTIHGLLGPNGAGKSTTMKILAGLIKKTAGRVEIFGKEISPDFPLVKKQIGVLMENPPLYSDMVVEDYLDFVAAIHGVEKRRRKAQVQITLEKTQLTEVRKRLIGNLSKGFQQRVGVAQALVFDPPLLILDEPSVGLDPASIIEMRNLIHSLKGSHTLLLSSHYLHEIASSVVKVKVGDTLFPPGIAPKRNVYPFVLLFER